jgi:hypothetical protein
VAASPGSNRWDGEGGELKATARLLEREETPLASFAESDEVEGLPIHFDPHEEEAETE